MVFPNFKNKITVMRNLIGTILIIAGAAIIIFMTNKQIKFSKPIQNKINQNSEAICKRLQNKISNNDDKSIFKYFNLTKEYKFNLHSEAAKLLFNNPNECFQGKINGTLATEVEVFDIPDENKPGVIFQFSFLDIKSKNKLYEYGINFYLEELKTSQQSKE